MKMMMKNNLKLYEDFVLNEDQQGLIDGLRGRVQELNTEVSIYKSLLESLDVDLSGVDELYNLAANWEVDPGRAIKEAHFNIGEAGLDSLIVYAMEYALRIAYFEEFNNFDWEDADVDAAEILNEDNYDIIELDMSGDGSSDWEEAEDRADLRRMFENIKRVTLQNQIEWEDDDDYEDVNLDGVYTKKNGEKVSWSVTNDEKAPDTDLVLKFTYNDKEYTPKIYSYPGDTEKEIIEEVNDTIESELDDYEE